MSGDKTSKMEELLDRHSRLAAEARTILDTLKSGTNLTLLAKCDKLLREIAGLPSNIENK